MTCADFDTGIDRIDVILSPVDFRTRSLPEDITDALPAWTGDLYAQIRARLTDLPLPSPTPPGVEAPG